MSDASAASVSFHTGVAEVVPYALRLIRKALSQGWRVWVSAPSEVTAELDVMLWAFEPGSFVPHMRWSDPARPVLLPHTPVVLAEGPMSPPANPAIAYPVLLNLGTDLPPGAHGCTKVIEVVGAGPDERRLGQARWRVYRELGFTPLHHAVS